MIRDIFINYFQDDTRGSPVNLAVARIILGMYIVWRALSIETTAFYEWPYILGYERYRWLLISDPIQLAPLAKYALVITATLFTVGYRTPGTAFISSIFIAYLGGIQFLWNISGETEMLFIAIYFLIFFALYSEQDYLSVDSVRGTRQKTLQELNSHLQTPTLRDFSATPLKWGLLVIGVIYFGAGLTKILNGSIWTWTDAANQGRYLLQYKTDLHREFVIGELLLDNHHVLELLAWLTVVSEIGFIIAIIAGLSITPLVIGLCLLHTGIALSLGLIFLDLPLFLFLFFSYDKVYEKIVLDRQLEIVYDDHCYFCVRSLYLFKYLDINQSIKFTPNTAAEESDYGEVDFTGAMYAFDEQKNSYEGYWAFRELLRQFRIFALIVMLMRVKPVSRISERIYQYIADRCGQIFVCSLENAENADESLD
ncbi:DCC1-like thiol-disulfide oxidoreductase family protein [Halorussus halobius]|uniref:DCC1-like thiol-disulfide oxidoreductase family protein n=1 Tax=Halorussus halobius TaxID=1710537 RepID=UPI001092D11C|nr:DCC1-like thiol-disulfide oxidoreductase family protein [Halorussus halobius]